MSNEPLDGPIRLLQYQIRQRLSQDINRVQGRGNDWRFEVLMRPSFTIGSPTISPSTLNPALCVIEHLPVANSVARSTARVRTGPMLLIRWLLDIQIDNSLHLSHGFEQGIAFSKGRSKAQSNGSNQLLAIAEGCDYWSLCMASVELRMGTLGVSKQQPPSKLLQVGERAIATALPNLVLRLHEPLPLYFLTRTLTGQRTYAHTPLPLQVCDLPI